MVDRVGSGGVDATSFPQPEEIGPGPAAETAAPAAVERGGTPAPRGPEPPAARPVDPARVKADVEALHEAMSGIGTAEAALFGILEGRTPAELAAIEVAFDERYRSGWGSLRLALHEELSGEELARAIGALDKAARAPAPAATTPKTWADADTIHTALNGIATDEEAIYRVLENRSPAEVRAIEAAFARAYGDEWGSLRIALFDDMSGAELERAIAALDRAAPSVGSPDFDRLLDAETGSVARPGTSAEMLFDGVQSFEKRYELIGSAESSINLQTFIFNDDETGWKTARALAAAAERGVDVKLMYDPLGSHLTKDEIFDFMREAGVQVIGTKNPYTRPWTLNERWHEKLLVVDGKKGITGGMNVGDEYAFGGSALGSVRSRDGGEDVPWRDTDILLSGPTVQDLQRAFVRNWETEGGSFTDAARAKLFPPLTEEPTGSEVRFVQHRPVEDGSLRMKALYLRAIAGAREHIRIESAYFVPPPEVKDALLAAARRGVKVEVLTNAREWNDMPVVSDASRYHYDDLLAAGIQIYEKSDKMLHAKTATFDGQLSIVGSANLNGRSDGQDSESVAVVRHPGIALDNERRFATGLEAADRITAADLADEGAWEDFKQFVLQPFAWMI